MAAKKAYGYDYNRTSSGSAGRTRTSAQTLYVEGNAVRKSLTIDFPKEDFPEEDFPQEERRRGSDRRSGRRQEAGVRRHRATQQDKGLSLWYMIGLVCACVATLYMCVNYLKLQADNTATLENIADLEEQLDELETENNDEYNRIVSSVDLEEIREKAINELGMVYAGEDQVVLYDGSENDYVTQYGDIPEEESTLQSVLGIINTGN